MSAKDELNKLLTKLNVTNAVAASAIGVHERTIYKWLAGDRKVPMTALLAFRLLLEKKEATLKK